MLVGTGDVSSTISFYEHCGFTISHRVENFFTDNYDHPIYEEGKLLTDMVYLIISVSWFFFAEDNLLSLQL